MTASTGFLFITVILASAVEMVEAMTIILASGITRGWRSTLEGTAVALLALTAITVVLGPALVTYVPVGTLRLVVGTLLLIFGLQWLRKAILRASGHKSQHDENTIFRAETVALKNAPAAKTTTRDPVAFAVSFIRASSWRAWRSSISFGVPAGHLGLAASAAALAAVVIGVAGAVLAKPLAGVPENAMKMGVGLMLSTFGGFWMGEGIGVDWPGADLFILALLGVFTVVSFVLVQLLKRARQATLSQVGAS